VEAKKISLKVPSEIINIEKVSSEVLKSLSSYGIDEDRLCDIRLCTEEAVRNAIVHGNRSNKELYVKVDHWVDNNRFYIEIEDEGAGFAPDRVPDPTGNGNILKESGRGVLLIKKLMDRVDFNEKGNRIRMEKALE
jgi:serine/threonine-protein kinase RsbW